MGSVTLDKDYAKFRSTYSDQMIDDPEDIIARFRTATEGVDFDTIVGRGSSGMLIVPVVARALRKKWFIVRKDEEARTSHSGIKWLGDLGKRWVFLDDFCSSGRTFRATRDGVKAAVERVNSVEQWDEWAGRYVRPNNFKTELVGYFEYKQNPDHDGWHLWDELAVPGYGGGNCLDDTPMVLAQKARRDVLEEERDRERGVELQYEAERQAAAYAEAASQIIVDSIGGGGGGGILCGGGTTVRDDNGEVAIKTYRPIGMSLGEWMRNSAKDHEPKITIRTGVF